MGADRLEMPDLGDEGYLNDPEDWDSEVAQRLASAEGIKLTPDHWRVLEYMRDYYAENGIAADARFVIRFLGEQLGYGADARTRLFQLFPYGYVKQACKIAGMRRPRAWSTG
ncbi:MAG TPA: TusE/DsrC/DsvC family sulfur relay protein [Gammaproteobacteria bacterium]